MHYSKYPYKLVNVRLLHNGCWTSYVDDYVVRSLGRSYQPDDNAVRSLVVVNAKSMKVLMNLKDEGKIKDIVNVHRYGDNFVVDILQSYNNSILSVLNKYGAIILDTVKTNKREFWSFLTYEYKIPKIIDDLKNLAVVERVKVTDYDPSIREINLTELELKCLITAAKAGYFDYPKKVRAKELAQILGIKESTFIYHLRNAQRKMISKLLNDLDLNENLH
ncbi:helix-turn-helix domain-containing protein [Sulfolobus tengchongensis]|uniref:Helix-turn-helix domain-containing protein n=1 Tax=Sulfolobus tengchongensis TaxID=207809 RepID=A0AAX4L2A3_9CREN